MHILQICKKNPFPVADGEAIAIWSITKELHRAGHEVTLLAMNTPKHNFNVDQLPEDFKSVAKFETVFINTNLNLFSAFKALLQNRSYNIKRFISQDFANKLTTLLKEQHFDIVLMEGIYLAPYLNLIKKIAPDTPVFMRTHNIEHLIWQRLAQEEKNIFKSIYLKILAKQFKSYEKKMLPEFDGLIPISPIDANILKQLGCHQKMMVLPAGVDTNNYPFLLPDQTPEATLFFIGSLDWLPNRQGLIWLFNEVLPIVRKTFPEVQLYVAGRNSPDSFKHQQIVGVNIVGEVPDAIRFMMNHTIMVVPLFSGSGMRVKIIEAMALGKPIVATSIAAEGIEYSDGKNILIADSAERFAENIIVLLKNKSFCNQISTNARNFALEYHDNNFLVKKLIAFFFVTV
ncbi:MAG: glycosyltransferase [Sphingobacteriales bacterium]|nr:MAG: glycosyltransferase [Sphingobacteriales bacterium]